MTGADCRAGNLVLVDQTVEVRQSIHAVYYLSTQLAARIACFLDFLAANLGGEAGRAPLVAKRKP